MPTVAYSVVRATRSRVGRAGAARGGGTETSPGWNCWAGWSRSPSASVSSCTASRQWPSPSGTAAGTRRPRPPPATCARSTPVPESRAPQARIPGPAREVMARPGSLQAVPQLSASDSQRNSISSHWLSCCFQQPQQSGTRKQHGRDRHLRDNQRSTQQKQTRRRHSRARSEPRMRTELAGTKRRHEADDECDDRRRDERKRKHARRDQSYRGAATMPAQARPARGSRSPRRRSRARRRRPPRARSP